MTKLTPIQANLDKNKGNVHKKLSDKRKKIKSKFQINDLVRGVADLKKTFSKGERTKWFYKLNRNTEVIGDTIPNYRINNLQERYDEALLRQTELSMKENDSVMKKLNLS